MKSVSRGAFDAALALGHHWAGEEHFLRVPQPDRTLWGEDVFLPRARLDDVLVRLNTTLRSGSWGFNTDQDGRAWVSAQAGIDLSAIVADVLAS